MAGAVVFNIPHLKAKILYEFGGLQAPIARLLGGRRYRRAARSDKGSTFSERRIAKARTDHLEWVVWHWMPSYRECQCPSIPAGAQLMSASPMCSECADHPFWTAPFPILDSGPHAVAPLQARLRADISDILLEDCWCETMRSRSYRAFGGHASRCLGRSRPRAWGPCGIDLSVAMPRTTLLSIAGVECASGEQPGARLTKAQIVRHILSH